MYSLAFAVLKILSVGNVACLFDWLCDDESFHFIQSSIFQSEAVRCTEHSNDQVTRPGGVPGNLSSLSLSILDRSPPQFDDLQFSLSNEKRLNEP